MRKLAALSLVFAAACAPAVAPPPPAPTPAPPSMPAAAAAAEGEVPLAVRWVRASAEHRAAFLQAYRQADERLRAVEAGVPDGTWAVILDADETVLDNSTYQLRRARQGLGYTVESWNEWVREEAAPALAGAAEFTRTVRQLGGRVVIVTNRGEEVCEPTRDNLREVGVPFDLVLCQPTGAPSDKNPRFRAVQEGTAGLPPLRVLMWVGDNIRDFPGLDQPIRTGGAEPYEPFGRTHIILPNPMYGSWERLPVP